MPESSIHNPAPAGRRGYQASDERDFSHKALRTLHKAAAELSFLLDHDYPRDTSVEFVGNRYQFSARQRLFLQRGVCGEARRAARAQTCLPATALAGQTVLIDGFNVIVPLEVALGGGPLIRAQDGAIRDFAGVSGTYRAVEQTMRALDLLLDTLTRLRVAGAVLYFDRPVSNSGRLAKTIDDYVAALSSIQPGLPAVRTLLAEDVDKALAGRGFVATNDSAVIDRCESWVNLDAEVLGQLSGVWILDALETEFEGGETSVVPPVTVPPQDAAPEDRAASARHGRHGEASATAGGTSAPPGDGGQAADQGSPLPFIPVRLRDIGDTFLS